MRKLCEATLRYQVDLALGYIEKSQDRLYSSYAVIERGRLLHNYRRISRGWKEFRITNDHYQEGTATTAFWYHGQRLQIALCGDLWDFPERFKTDGVSHGGAFYFVGGATLQKLPYDEERILIVDA